MGRSGRRPALDRPSLWQAEDWVEDEAKHAELQHAATRGHDDLSLELQDKAARNQYDDQHQRGCDQCSGECDVGRAGTGHSEVHVRLGASAIRSHASAIRYKWGGWEGRSRRSRAIPWITTPCRVGSLLHLLHLRRRRHGAGEVYNKGSLRAEIRPRSSSWPQSGTWTASSRRRSFTAGFLLRCFGLSVPGGEQDARDPC
jgi:hypothetical protein